MQQVGEALVEAFLIVDQPRQRLGHWAHALAPLDDQAAPPLAQVRAFWDPTTDQALINLAYDPFALGADRLHYVVELALLAELGMIQPAELTKGDRRRFLEERLARCTLRVDNQRNVVGALTELVRQIRERRLRPPPTPARGVQPRGDTEDPVMLVKAKGTRDLVPTPRPSSPFPAAASTTRRTDDSPVSPHIVPRVQRARTVEMTPEELHRQVSSTRRARSPSEVETADLSQRLSEMIAPAPGRAASAVDTDALPSVASPPPSIIYARFLRSGRWVPIRVGALSLKGATLMTGALPRIDDSVDIALSFAGHRALVRGHVAKLSTDEEVASSGASSFHVTFALDDAARRQLTTLLTAARAAKITIKPAPPRTGRRFPVDWAIALQTGKGVVRSEALDISRDGMFVHPQHSLILGATVSFSSVLDDGNGPIAGRARIVRHITEQEARMCGLVAGYGLHITEMGEGDRTRWLAFVERVEKRAERRVLIGASPVRLAELQADLAAAGYAVTGATDPGALVQLASAEARPVDAAMIDGGWLSPQHSPEWVESLFSARNVPCVTFHGEAKRARAIVDRLLLTS